MLLKIPKRKKLVISLTPLIDVVFILLVFFMLASSFLNWREYEIATTPAASDSTTSSSTEKTPNARVLLKASGEWLLDGQPIANEFALQTALRKRITSEPELRVTIQPEGPVPMQDAMDALDAVKTVGIKAVSLRPAAITAGNKQ